MKKLLSIIIVTYGEIYLLKDCLKSVKNSNFWNFYNGEVIIINNLPSVPIKPEFVKKNLGKHQYRLIKNKKNLGYIRAANLGFKKAKGEILLFLNPDVYLLKDTVVSMIRFLEKKMTNSIIAPRLYLDKTLKIPQPYQYGYFPNPIKETMGMVLGLVYQATKIIFFKKLASFFDANLLKMEKPTSIDWVSGAVVMIKKDVFKKIGTFDERFFFYFDDVDLQKRMKNKGLESFILPAVKAIHIWGGSEIKEANEYFKKSKKLYYLKYYNFLVRLIFSIGDRIRNFIWRYFLIKTKINNRIIPKIYLD